MSDTEWLNPISTEAKKVKREAVKRRKAYQELSVLKSGVQEHIDAGWEIDRELKIKTCIRKPWAHDQKLENKVWHLSYLLGYPEISSGRNFQITIKRKGAGPYKKQIDVLAKDDEKVIVTECTALITTTIFGNKLRARRPRKLQGLSI